MTCEAERLAHRAVCTVAADDVARRNPLAALELRADALVVLLEAGELLRALDAAAQLLEMLREHQLRVVLGDAVHMRVRGGDVLESDPCHQLVPGVHAHAADLLRVAEH